MWSRSVLMGTFGLQARPQPRTPTCTSVRLLLWDQVGTSSETGRRAHARARPRQFQILCDLQEMKTRTDGHQQETETETGPLASWLARNHDNGHQPLPSGRHTG